PRTLSTVLGKLFAESSDIGCWSNEPTSKFGFEDQRVDASYRTVLEAIAKATPSKNGVRRVLLSIIASSVGPEKEIEDLIAVSEKVSFSIRNPLLAIESFILLIAQILAEVGSAPKSKTQMLREGWVPPESNLDHLNEGDPDLWMSHVRHLRRTRDYRWVTDRQHYIANSIANTAAFRRELWADPSSVALVHSGNLSLLREHLSPDPAYKARIEKALDLDSDSLFSEAPDLHAIVAYTAASWLQTWRLFEATRKHTPSKLGPVVDATQFQLRADKVLDLLRESLGIEKRCSSLGSLVSMDGYGEQYAQTQLKAETMFARAYASTSVAQPEKAPLALWRLPAFVKRHLPLDMLLFMSLSAQPECALPVFGSLSELLESPCPQGESGEQPLMGLDPVYAYLQSVVAFAQGKPEGKTYREAIRAQHPMHAATLNLVDEAAVYLSAL
ncbi:MAG: hypothetical protein AAGF35_09560, partial [Pseudomonadota bacterium]